LALANFSGSTSYLFDDHGKRGELFQRYREGQEDQLSALGLVVNMIVLWNTLYMDAVLAQLRHEGYPVRSEEEVRLSPFGHEHITCLDAIHSRCRKPPHAENCSHWAD
jgi:hypothetical protein